MKAEARILNFDLEEGHDWVLIKYFCFFFLVLFLKFETLFMKHKPNISIVVNVINNDIMKFSINDNSTKLS